MKHVFSILTLVILLGLISSCGKDDSATDDLSNNDISIIDKDGTFLDKRDGQRYMTVKIGEQIWMAENLAYLPAVNKISQYSYTEKYYYVNGYDGTNIDAAKTTDNYKNYGALYNWPSAIDACPAGWHLPTVEEWNQLAEFISKDNGGYTKSGFNWNKIGDHLKSVGKNDEYDQWWKSYDSVCLDDYGFRGLPAGFFSLMDFWEPGISAQWWTISGVGTNYAWSAEIRTTNYLRIADSAPRYYGCSIRCIKN